MRKLLMTSVLAIAFSCFGFGQGGKSGMEPGQGMPGGSGNGNTNPSAEQSSASSSEQGAKTLRGCLQPQGGSYVLQEKDGRTIALNSSQDLSAHVGHEVKVHGNWIAGSSAAPDSNAQQSATNGSAALGSNPGAGTPQNSSSTKSQFNVDNIDMVSSQCKTSGSSK